MGGGRAEGSSAIGEEGKRQFHSHLMLMAQALDPCWVQLYLLFGKTVQWCLGRSSYRSS